MFSQDDSWNIFKLLAAILHIGNLEFEGTSTFKSNVTFFIIIIIFFFTLGGMENCQQFQVHFTIQ